MPYRTKIKLLVIVTFLVAIFFGVIGGCDDDSGGGDFRVFNVELFGFEFDEEFFGTCSQNTAELVLRLSIDGSEASGFFQLMGFDRVGPKTKVIGTVDENAISFQPFSVSVNDGMNVAGFGPSSLHFSFDSLTGTLIDTDGDEFPDEITGNASASISEIKEGDIVICDGFITADFIAMAEGS